MQYCIYVDNLAQKSSQKWKGIYETEGKQHRFDLTFFIAKEGIIKGHGKDEQGEYDINGVIEKDGKFKFNKKYLIDKGNQTVYYYGQQEEKKLVGYWQVEYYYNKFELEQIK